MDDMNRLIFHTQDIGDIAFMMSKTNLMYLESLEKGKTFSEEELERIKAWDGLIQDHIDKAYRLVKEVYSKVFNLRYGRD